MWEDSFYKLEIEKFVEQMDRFHNDPDFQMKHDMLKQYFEDYRDQTYKTAIAYAIDLDEEDYGKTAQIYWNITQALEKWLDHPFLSQYGIELNAWRVIFQIDTNFKLAEAWEYFKAGGITLTKQHHHKEKQHENLSTSA